MHSHIECTDDLRSSPIIALNTLELLGYFHLKQNDLNDSIRSKKHSKFSTKNNSKMLIDENAQML